MSNLNVSSESTMSDHSKTCFIFDISPFLKKWEQNNLYKNYIQFSVSDYEGKVRNLKYKSFR